MHIHKSVASLILLILISIVACGKDDPTSSDPNGNGADVTAPAAVTDLRTNFSTTSSIALVWTAPGDDNDTGTASEYDLRFSPVPVTDQNWDTAIPVDGELPPKAAGGIETFVVAGLEPAQAYYFALKTSDEVPNVSMLSNVASDSTQQETVPPAAVSDLSAEGIADGSFRLTWTAPGDDGNAGDASEYDIRYSTSPILDENWDNAAQVEGEGGPKPAGSPDTMVVTGLEFATNYFFAMKAADEVPNWSAISNLYPAMANGNNLWIFPYQVKAGDYLTIIYRTPDTGTSKLHAHFRNEVDQWARLVIEWEWPPGIHTREWDFKRSGEYHSYPYNFYTIKLYWNSVVVAEAVTRLVQ